MSGTAFEDWFRGWVKAACREWGWPEPDDHYYGAALERLPTGLRAILVSGVAKGLIVPHGWTFTLKKLAAGKGPYRWFSERRWEGGPHPNWEYFVQVAEFVRLQAIAAARNLRLNFEDDLMDLALYTGDRLVVCVEAKEQVAQLQRLIAGIRRYQDHVDLNMPDRGNDALRKAKYIVKRRPDYFCAVALGARLEYRVHYRSEASFQLHADFIPWL